MKKLLCFAMFAFGMSVQAQSIDSLIDKNTAIKEAVANEDYSLSDKIKVVNDQVDIGRITKEQAYHIITKLSNQQSDYMQAIPDDESVEMVKVEVVDAAEENYDYDWGKETSPFDFAMGVQMDTVVKYGTKTTPYIAFGVGNVAIDGAFANSEFGYMRSNYFEWGIAARTPFSKTNNKWGIRYGLGFKYNGLATTQNRIFGFRGENQTVTMPSEIKLRKNYAYLRNTYINIPISLDFTTTSKVYNEANRRFTTKEGINFGIGGYVGYNINSKQHLRHEVGDYKTYAQQKGDWNVNDFNYGLTAYAGKDHFKLVLKYDLSPVFTDNVVDQNYWSVGLQLGL